MTTDPSKKPADAARLVLAIETSNPGSRGAPPSIALGELVEGPPRLIDVEPLRSSHRHDDDLTPAISRLMSAHGARPDQLARVAVSVGPGGYTALRIALATSKVIAKAVGAELVGVPSALVAALDAPALPALILLASKNETVHASLAMHDGGPDSPDDVIARAGSRSIRLRTLGLMGRCPDLDQVVRRSVCVVADEHFPATIRATIEHAGVDISGLSLRAQSVLALSDVLPASNPAELTPIYPREPDAVTQWRKRSQVDRARTSERDGG